MTGARPRERPRGSPLGSVVALRWCLAVGQFLPLRACAWVACGGRPLAHDRRRHVAVAFITSVLRPARPLVSC